MTDKSKKTKKVEMKINLNDLFSKGLLFILIGVLFLPFILNLVNGGTIEVISLSQFVSDVREEKIEKVDVRGEELMLTYADGSEKTTRKEAGQGIVDILSASDIDVNSTSLEIKDLSFSAMFWELMVSILPIILMVVFFFFLFRQARGGAGDMMGMGKSKAKLFVKGKQNTKFDDVGGMDEAKKELEEIVDFLKNPKKYEKVGARTPKGVLLVGPAGTGKTLLARAVAGEANVQFLSIAGSEFMEMLVGVGASRVRDLFTTAKKLSPAIIFIDEIDAIGRMRGQGNMGGHDEREQTLNQILVEMDGFAQNEKVIVMAATNRGDMLDPALVRPGRFDRRVLVRLPDLEERKYILSIHAKGKPFVSNLTWEKVARRTVGFSGADLENMLNEAAIAVAREARTEITMEDIEEASLKVKLGPSKKRLQDKHEREMTAYHEAGHALIAHLSAHADPVHRISIVSRGRALGFTLTPPEKDKLQTTKSELIDRIAVLMGGRAAEELIFSELTAGASSDIERATRIARAMVTEYGMSTLGPMNYTPLYDNQDFGRAWGEASHISAKVQEQVDEETQRFLAEGYAQAFKLLKANKKTLDAVSQKLVDVESLDADEFAKLMGESKTKFEYKPVLSSKISDAKVAEEKEEKRVASEKKSKKSK
ncbi:MAG: cell division protein FtsH [Candidatus Pacebacteria bacterium CG_4_9_14_3_um_filter_40_12]|nr:MAG: cell division protein FtsH [Candidatus Pacebacteria bacterium CG10_big_fil_rev_8_21_14_0_10_40_26]PIZ79717.1 MAG: cell division protein FtsH [Candidatus Pacebacteria bacterium CG_4_10_14_0_2_um_filter_40_20]PJA68362.1 MAG: cell division protein FtsH [Candidatus Pacebacteria bacterium CG_4_9_14_3_um_filter_40_12]PJC41224.1 MAG: cell division protein FtsH [Candidatus Pacebacteria bacterium CG_4_9_14_0_2_um_filter_40_15]